MNKNKEMGRKKKVVRFQLAYEVQHSNSSSHPSLIPNDKASNASSSEMKTDVEKLHPQAMEGLNVENNEHQIFNGAKRGKKSRAGSVVVRRSTRIKSRESPSNSLDLEVDPIVEHVGLIEDEKEQEPEVREGSSPPESNTSSLEEKVDYLVGAVDFFKSKVFQKDDAVPSPDISYKSLYINSQKKIESLIEDNYDLVRKLEFARGKIAAYEVMKNAQKEFVVVSEMGKAADMAASLSPKAVQKSTPSHPAASLNAPNKPKKPYKKRVRRV